MPAIRDPLVLLSSRLDGFGEPDRCWIWTGASSNLGYGRLNHRGRMWYAHRFAYVTLRGEIPDGLVLDHLCGRRLCCNPAHLDVVTLAENTRRGPVEHQSLGIVDMQLELW